MKPVFRNLTLLVVVAAVFLSLVEVTLRLTHLFGARLAWTQPDDTIGWRFTPGREYWFDKENDHPIEGKINGNGWRDHERDIAAAPGVMRIAVLGDSYVEAFQVELDSTFCSILQRELERRSRQRVEVLNFGRSGMTQSEELLILEDEVLAYRPDIVVVLFVPQNDIADMSRSTAMNPLRPFYSIAPDGELTLDTSFNRDSGYLARKRINALKQRSALVSLIAERYNVLRRAPRADAGGASPRIAGYLSLCTAQPDSTYARSYQINRRLIEEMSLVCARGGVPMVLLSNYVSCDPALAAGYRSADATFDEWFFESDLAALCASRGIRWVPLQAAFRSAFLEGGEPLAWVHWNYRGHQVAAGLLADAISPSR